MIHRIRLTALIALSFASVSFGADLEGIKKSITLLATFDNGPNADFAKGDPTLYSSATLKRENPKPGLPPDVTIAAGKGKRGGALHFVRKNGAVPFYRVTGNVAYTPRDWSGTVSFWISVDPEKGLPPGYTDPIQITERAWNDAALWVDFNDKSPRRFRMGTFADLKVWNPTGKDFEKMTPEERPMVDAGEPPFAEGKWSHVAIVFERFNSGKPDGKATLYIDGKSIGSVRDRVQTFSWNPDMSAVMLGLSFSGMLDELAIFDRALSGEEVRLIADGASLRK